MVRWRIANLPHGMWVPVEYQFRASRLPLSVWSVTCLIDPTQSRSSSPFQTDLLFCVTGLDISNDACRKSLTDRAETLIPFFRSNHEIRFPYYAFYATENCVLCPLKTRQILVPIFSLCASCSHPKLVYVSRLYLPRFTSVTSSFSAN